MIEIKPGDFVATRRYGSGFVVEVNGESLSIVQTPDVEIRVTHLGDIDHETMNGPSWSAFKSFAIGRLREHAAKIEAQHNALKKILS